MYQWIARDEKLREVPVSFFRPDFSKNALI